MDVGALGKAAERSFLANGPDCNATASPRPHNNSCASTLLCPVRGCSKPDIYCVNSGPEPSAFASRDEERLRRSNTITIVVDRLQSPYLSDSLTLSTHDINSQTTSLLDTIS